MDEVYPDKNITFKVESRRAKKTYPKKSMEINYDLGEEILEAFPETSVDVHHPEVMIHIEIRQNRFISIPEIIPDPEACRLAQQAVQCFFIRRNRFIRLPDIWYPNEGVRLEATYFHAPPYTSERAKQKVMDLAKQVSKIFRTDQASCGELYRYPALYL